VFNTLKTEFLLNNINSVRISQETHYVSATKPNRLMLFRETVAVYCENHTEHTNIFSTGYGSGGWEIGVRFLAGEGDFSLLHNVQTSSGAHPASYRMGIGGSLTWGKATGEWRWPPTLIKCRSQEWWNYTSTPHTSSWRGVSLIKRRDNFTLPHNLCTQLLSIIYKMFSNMFRTY
jgi:hypothetical protein